MKAICYTSKEARELLLKYKKQAELKRLKDEVKDYMLNK